MTRAELLNMHKETCTRARAIMEKKNHDYTSGSEDPFANFNASTAIGVHPAIGILMRCMDKFKRIQTFVEKGKLEVANESVDDAIEDVINYMILCKGVLKDAEVQPST